MNPFNSLQKKKLQNLKPVLLGFLFLAAISPKVSLANLKVASQNDTELTQTYASVLQTIPTFVAAAVKNKVDIVSVSFKKNYASESKQHENDLIHSLSSIENENSKWILKVDSSWRQKTSCSDTVCKSFIKKLITHQLAHIFDETGTLKPKTEQELKMFRFCSYSWEITKGHPPAPCRILSKLKKSVSDHPDFLSLISIQEEPQEFFATHFVKYMFDTEYECHFPGFYNFFEKTFGHSNQQKTNTCKPNYKIPQLSLNDQASSQIDIDPSRVYRIDYFLAGSGDELSSKWGHTMFRIVICSPEHKEPSEDCVGDTAYHVVAGFSAVVTDELEIWNGLTGKYPSVITVQPLSDFIMQYNIGEDRSLISYPIRFSRSEIKNFISHIVDAYWNHNKKYYFLGNNCATEGLSLIKRAIQRPYSSLYLSDLIVMTPNNLLNVLQASKLIAAKDIDKQKERHVSYFPSMKETFLAKLDPAWEKFWYYSSSQLRQVYQQYKANSSQQYEVATRFQALERTRLMRLKQKYNSWIQGQVETSTDTELKKQGLEIKSDYLNILNKLRLRRSESPNFQDEAGEVPLEANIQQSFFVLADMQKDLSVKFEELSKMTSNRNLKSKFPRVEEFTTAVENFSFYSKEIAKYLSHAKK